MKDQKKGKKLRNILVITVATVLLLAIISLTMFAAFKIHSYAEASQLCAQIRAGQEIDTDIADAITAPLFIRPLLTMIEAGIDIPLVEACYYNNLQAVEVLLDNGADPNFYLDGGWSPMEATVAWRGGENAKNVLPMMKLLYEHGADIDGYGSHGSALYHISSALVVTERERAEQEIEILFWLLDNGANPIISKDGTTVLHYAVRGAHPELIPILIEQYGLDVQARGYMQRTPLISAVSYTVSCQDEQITKQIVEELLAHGADATATDEDGKTAYDYAVERGYTEVATLLTQE